jgi:hypothetical protein
LGQLDKDAADCIRGIIIFVIMAKYPKRWRELIRTMILLRDDFTCQLCLLKSISNHVHHVDYSPMILDGSNMFTLCPSCHRGITLSKIRTCQIAKSFDDEMLRKYQFALSQCHL